MGALKLKQAERYLLTALGKTADINPFLKNVEKWPNNARFLKHFWTFFNIMRERVKTLSVKTTKWSNTHKLFVGNRYGLNVFHHFVGLALKGLKLKNY